MSGRAIDLEEARRRILAKRVNVQTFPSPPPETASAQQELAMRKLKFVLLIGVLWAAALGGFIGWVFAEYRR